MNWFVVAGAAGGDGSRENPFRDPWQALRASSAGDAIHVAAGTYYGRYDRSSWIVDVPQLTVLGGYSNDFSTRTPWQTPSVFAAYVGYEVPRDNQLIAGRNDHSGLRLDGLFFDSAGRNSYEDKPTAGLSRYSTMEGAIASFNSKNVTIKNCVFANSGTNGVELSGDGSRFENNLLINIVGTGMLDLRSAPGGPSQPIHVLNNSFYFAHDTAGPPFGKGADNAIGIRVKCPAVIQNNLFVGCGNAAIRLYGDGERISVDNNLFYLNPRAVLAAPGQGSMAEILESNIDEMEDVGLESCSGNSVANPQIVGLKPAWFDAYSRHLLALYAKPPTEAANAWRTSLDLPALTPSDLQKQDAQGDFAPRLLPAEVLALSSPVNAGCHAVSEAVSIPADAAETGPNYKTIEWSAMLTPDSSLAQQRVQLRAGLGTEQNITLLAGLSSETHIGLFLYQPGTDDGSVFVLAPRQTLVQRQYEESFKSTAGRDVESTYFIRGVYRSDLLPSSRQKATIVVESIVPAPAFVRPLPARPIGRDWFVKAGSNGGDGSREKPFRDPFQALDKAEGGDAVHVSGGDYFGKLHSGQWTILVRHLSLLGGYDADFKERDPWKNPTRFVLGAEEKAKGARQGLILSTDGNAEGLILDGFVFDGSSYNNYTKNGAIDLNTSPTDTMVRLTGTRVPIVVRNCLFINSATESVCLSGASGVFENNILMNANGWLLRINAGGAGPWTIRHNTFLFAGDPTPRAGTGQSAPDGTLVLLTGRAETLVESNIFAFADNYGVRCEIAQPLVTLKDNVFAGNLFNHLTDAQYLWADGSTWERRAVADSAFAAITGNTLDLPSLPVDSASSDQAMARLFKLPSRVSVAQWNTLATQIGSTVRPAVPERATSTTPAPAPEPVAAPAASALDSLLASLDKLNTQIAKAAPPKRDSESGPVYCPIFDWKKALALAQEGSEGPGARHLTCPPTVFAGPQAHAEIQYKPLKLEELTGDLAAFENQAVEIEVTEARESSTNPSLFPAGTSKEDWVAYFVSPGAATRTRLSIVGRQDTAVVKVLYRLTPTDRLRVRGTAHVLYPGALAIVVDHAERADSIRSASTS